MTSRRREGGWIGSRHARIGRCIGAAGADIILTYFANDAARALGRAVGWLALDYLRRDDLILNGNPQFHQRVEDAARDFQSGGGAGSARNVDESRRDFGEAPPRTARRCGSSKTRLRRHRSLYAVRDVALRCVSVPDFDFRGGAESRGAGLDVI